MLADHNAVDAHVPHHRRAVPSELEVVIDLLPFVGTLNGRTTFVDEIPLLRPANGFGEQAKIITAMCVVRPTVFGIRTPAGRGASPLAAVLRLVEPVRLHLVAFRTNRNACRGNLDVAVRCRILLAAVVEIDERLDVLMIEKQIDGFRIMGGIEKHFVYRAQGESLLEFDCAYDQTDSVMPRGRLQSRIQGQIVFTVRRRDHVQVVPVEVLFSGAVPSRVAVGLGVKTRMVAFSYTAGTTIASRFASGIGGSRNRCAITGRAKRRNIPEQTQIRRDGKNLGLEKVEQSVGRQSGFLVGVAHHPLHQTLHFTGRGGGRLFAFLAFLGFALAFMLFLGFEVLVYGRPEAFEKVVERSDAGQIVKGKSAENGIDGGAFHFVDPFGQSHLGVGHEEDKEGSQQGSRIAGQGSPIGIDVMQERGNGGKIGHPKFGSERPILLDENDTGSIMSAELLEDKSLVIRMRNEDRFQEKHSNRE